MESDNISASMHSKRTTVVLDRNTREFLKNNDWRLATMVRAAPTWYQERNALWLEVNELKEGGKKKDVVIAKLYEKNAELTDFKAKVIEKMKGVRG